jgi:hypothetical protein
MRRGCSIEASLDSTTDSASSSTRWNALVRRLRLSRPRTRRAAHCIGINLLYWFFDSSSTCHPSNFGRGYLISRSMSMRLAIAAIA